MLDQQQHAGQAATESRRGNPLYRRPMPGGGYMEMEMEQPAAAGDGRPRGWVTVERRVDHARRIGHTPPVVVVLESDDRDELVTDLFAVAQDNAALARGLLRWQAARQRLD